MASAGGGGGGGWLRRWLLLATAPGGDVEKTKTDPVLSEARTPRLYEVYIEMLFIGLSDNTTLESFVSLSLVRSKATLQFGDVQTSVQGTTKRCVADVFC